MKKSLPIGISDFREIMEDGYYYADKSLLIKELLDSGSKAILFPRPRRFGKTLNLSMLRYFFEKSEEDLSGLFRDLAIWRQGDAYLQHQGQHPVIFLTFKDVKCRNWTDCAKSLQKTIGEQYRRHRYLMDNGQLDPDEIERFRAIIAQTADLSDYRHSLQPLSYWLERHHGRKTVILIDEYDTPIQEGYLHGYYEDVIDFMRSLLGSALKDNSSLEKGVMTGILRIAKESVFSGLNNLAVYSVLVPEFSVHFGLLETEVEELLAYYEVGLDPQQVKSWYNGYRFGNSTIYNPWSILNFADAWENGFKPYWVNTSGNDLIRLLLTRSGAEVKEDLEQLIQGDSIRKEINENIVFRQIDKHADALWSFLLFSGYLKIASWEQDKGLYGELTIPNREVEYLFETIVLDWFRENVGDKQQKMMLDALVTGDVETFGELFQHFVLETFSVFDTGGDHPEKVYHAFVLGLLVNLRDRYEVKSNRESGFGRYDVMLIPKSQDKGIIIEFKKTRRGETLEAAAVSALRQIEEKRYAAELEQRGIRDIAKVAVVFAGKEVFVAGQ